MLRTLVAILFLSLASVASGDNTHNGDTSFAPAKDISELDWQDPVELERVASVLG